MTSAENITIHLQFPVGHAEFVSVLRKISESLNGPPSSHDKCSTNQPRKTLPSLLEKAASLAAADASDDIIFLVTRDGEPTRHDLDQGSTGCLALRSNRSLTKICRQLSNYEEMLHDMIASINKRAILDTVPHVLPCDLIFLSEKGTINQKHLIKLPPEDTSFEFPNYSEIYYLSNLHLAKIEHVSAPLLRSLSKHSYRNQRVGELAMLSVLGTELGKHLTLPETISAAADIEGEDLTVIYRQAFFDVIGFLVLSEVWGPQLGHTAQDCCIHYIREMLRRLRQGNGTDVTFARMVVQMNYLTQFGALEYSNQGTMLHFEDAQMFIAAMRSLARVLIEASLKSDYQLLSAIDAQFGVRSGVTPKQTEFLAVLKDFLAPLITCEQEFL